MFRNVNNTDYFQCLFETWISWGEGWGGVSHTSVFTTVVIKQ